MGVSSRERPTCEPVSENVSMGLTLKQIQIGGMGKVCLNKLGFEKFAAIDYPPKK